MSKPKILFYGNCQIGSISQIFCNHPALKDKFTILHAVNYNLVNQSSYPAVAHFLLDTEGKNDQHQVKKIFADADIVIFQAIDNHKVPGYSLTKNIIPNFNGLSICIPSFWYSGHFGHPYDYPMLDIFYYLHKLNISHQEAFHLLLNESIPVAEELFTYYHNYSIEGLKARSEEHLKVYNYISILDWLQDKYKNKLLCYNHSHPTPVFFEFIVNEILHKIDSSIENINFENFDFDHAGANGWFLPTKFRFFNDLFPDIDSLTELQVSKYDEWVSYTSHQPELFFNEGMNYIKDREVLDLIPDPKTQSILGII